MPYARGTPPEFSGTNLAATRGHVTLDLRAKGPTPISRQSARTGHIREATRTPRARSRGPRSRSPSSSGRDDYVLGLRHVAPGGRGGLLGDAPALASVH